jgi:hypothetical protein
MFTKSNNNGCRQCHGSSTPWRLRLNELERTVDSLELLVYSKCPAPQCKLVRDDPVRGAFVVIPDVAPIALSFCKGAA